MLLLLVAARQWKGRPRGDTEPEMPKWMHALDSITPIKAVGLGALLSGLNPKNLLLVVGARRGDREHRRLDRLADRRR